MHVATFLLHAAYRHINHVDLRHSLPLRLVTWVSALLQGLDLGWGSEHEQAQLEDLTIEDAEAALEELYGALAALGFESTDIENGLQVNWCIVRSC